MDTGRKLPAWQGSNGMSKAEIRLARQARILQGSNVLGMAALGSVRQQQTQQGSNRISKAATGDKAAKSFSRYWDQEALRSFRVIKVFSF